MGIVTAGPDDVDAAWLTAVLRSSGAITAASVDSFTAEAIGTGQVGHNVRFDLVYDVDEPGAPATVVAKFPSPDETSRATGVAIGTYDKEARFYAELASTVDIRVPRCHHVEHDPDAHLSTLVFEDMAPAVQGDQIEGCSVDLAAVAVDQLCALHAPRWDDPTLDQIAWLQRPTTDSGTTIQAFYAALWPGFLERYDGRVSDDVRRLGAKFGDGLARWAARRADGPITIVHGDFRLDNLLFRPALDPDGSCEVTVVDWQTVALGIGTDDLAYLLGSGLVTDDRRRHEEDMVRRYHDGLLARGVTGYSWDECWADYRRFSLSGLQMAVVASMIVRGDERGDAMFLAMAERHTAQALDLGADALLDA
ncbi:MAG: phosphotransferase [Acidimicrobiia bacterium]|nr:phosphotransferase [Acidimicrobiia bacterium]